MEPGNRRALGSSRAAPGFSLIELLLAVTIIALIGGMALIDYSGVLAFERLKATGRKLGGFCERARAQAISRQRSCALDLDFTHSRYRFVPDPARDQYGRFINPDTELLMNEEDVAEWNAAFEWEDLPRDVFFVDVQISAGEKFDERHGITSIRYPPDGTVDPFIIHLKTADGDLFSVAMNGMEGTAECAPGRADFPVAEATNFTNIMGNTAPGVGSSDKDKDKKSDKDKKDKGSQKNQPKPTGKEAR